MNGGSENLILFRKARWGYDKEDVFNYIEDLNIRFSKEKEDYERRIKRLEEELEKGEKGTVQKAGAESVDPQKEELEVRLSAVTGELIAAKKKADEYDSMRLQLEAKDKELNRLEKELENSKRESEGLKLMHDVAVTELDSAKAAGTGAGRKKTGCAGNGGYTEISKRIGSIILQANLDADKIISDAEAEADARRAEAEKKASDIYYDAVVKSRMMTEEVKEELCGFVGRYAEKITSLAERSSSECDMLYGELHAKAVLADSSIAERLHKIT